MVDRRGFVRSRKWVRRRILLWRSSPTFDYKDLIAFTYPEFARGLSLLVWTYKDPRREQDLWLWLPSLRKVRKISQPENDDTFVGSDFTYEELNTRRFESETYRLLRQGPFEGYRCRYDGGLYYRGEPCFVVEARPRRTPWYYTHRVVWLSQRMPGANVFERYYDQRGRNFKVLFRRFVGPPALKYLSQVLLENATLTERHHTEVIMPAKAIRYDQGLSERLFSLRALMRTKW